MWNLVYVAIVALGVYMLGPSYYQALKDDLTKPMTTRTYDTKTRIKWVDAVSRQINCVAKAPGKEAVPCTHLQKNELQEYRLVWDPRGYPVSGTEKTAYSE